ncbi:MAG TPA: biotin/lipoyl-binding protein [Candidatus Limnocylindrales bacterium]|nr:biotin/lipoyl-binding protein [Candidatus Limnocylindrales bacterium]
MVETTAEQPTWTGDLQFDETEIATPPSLLRRFRWPIVLVVLVALVAGAVWVINPFGSQAARPVTTTATTGTIVSSVSLSGTVASSTVKELAFGTSGTVTAVSVAVGDKVTTGQVLASVDPASYNVQLESAQANLAAAQAKLSTDVAGPTAATIASARDSVNQASLQLSQARQSLSDTQAKNTQSINQAKATLAAAKATLASDELSLPPGDPQLAKDQAAVDSATTALSAAQLNATLSLHQAQNQVASASLNLTSAKNQYNLKIAPATSAQIAADKASVAQAQLAVTNLQAAGPNITSPIDGTVTAVNLTVGQSVAGSSTGSSSSSSSSTTGQIEVMDLSKLQIAGQASETDIANLKMGQAATVTATALGSDTVVGSVCSLSNVGTQISGVASFAVTVCITGSNSSLLVGMSATAAVVTNRADGAVLVPSLAVKTVGGQQVVTVLAADGKTQTNVPVTVGISNGSETQILTGLQGGETVVETIQSNSTTNRNGGGRFFGPGGATGGVFVGG